MLIYLFAATPTQPATGHSAHLVTTRKNNRGIKRPPTTSSPETKSLDLAHTRGGWSELEAWFVRQYQRIMTLRLQLKDFIKRARKAHGNKYGYASVRYRNIDSRIKIKCPIHGYFNQTAWNHIGIPRSGCPKCGDLRSAEKRRKKRADSFVRDSQRIHGKKYDYSKAIYVSNQTPICIICKEHGEFWPTPDNHIRLKCKCPICSRIEMAFKVVRNYGKELILKLKRVHGNKYDYDKVKYRGASRTIRIRCKKHGYFNQITAVHLAGGGCKLCVFDKLKTLFSLSHEEFVKRARKKYGKKYKYLERYKNIQTPIRIRCPKHGVFKQAPNSHFKATGCPACSFGRTGFLNRLTHREFLKKVKRVHPTYSFTERYITAIKKIKTRCPRHGIFLMTPNSLLKGHGCQRCDDEKSADRIRLTHQEFLQRCRKVHAGKYSYPEKYKGGQIKIRIRCPQHGSFSQLPSGHLMGNGCPTCFDSSGERKISRALEILKVRFIRQKKFPDLLHKKQLRFDFWLPSFKTLIEFDGVQHFQASSFFGGRKAFEQTRLRDRIKNIWAKKMRLPLIRIPYTHPFPEKVLRKKLKI